MSELGELLQRARALVLDFDGTLVDSNPIKRRAFEWCFTEFPERREEILAYCWNHHHTPRGEKFRYVYESILRRPYTPEVATNLHARFEAATTQQIIEAPEIRGAEEFLRRGRHRSLIAILSSTPHHILLELLRHRGWLEYVAVAQGAPVVKAEWLTRFRQQHGFGEQDVVFFGDTAEDAEAAHTAQCRFVAVGNTEAAGPSGDTVRDFTDLDGDASDR